MQRFELNMTCSTVSSTCIHMCSVVIYYLLNRCSDCELLVPDDKSISRKHALIHVQANEKV